MMKVMSSREKFIFDQVYTAFFSKASAAAVKSSLRYPGKTIFITYSFYIYYHTPSEAITINLSI